MTAYKDMNIFDMASVLQNMAFDEELMFIAKINGMEFNIFNIEVEAGAISIVINNPDIQIINPKDLKDGMV